MPVERHIHLARHMQPVVASVAGLEDALVEGGVRTDKLHPAVCLNEVGVRQAIIPVGVAGLGQPEVSGQPQRVLAGLCPTHLHIQLRAAIARGDHDRLAYKGSQRLKHLFA